MSPDRALDLALVGFNIGRNVPLGLACLKAYVEARPDLRPRVRTTLLEYDIHCAPERALADLVRLRPAVVGFNAMHGSLAHALRLAPLLKQLLPSPVIVLGGVEVAAIGEKVVGRHPAIDCVVFGEGEETLAELLRRLADDAPLQGIAGTVDRRGEAVVRNEPRPPLDLAALPSPYLAGTVDVSRYAAVHLETFRGCPYRCEYCFEGRGFTGVRCFPEERVLAELALVLSAGCRTVKFFDTTFNFDRARALRILDFIAQSNAAGVRFGAEVRMELFDAEMAAAARRANLIDIETGLQTLNAATLARINRTFDRHLFERNLRGAIDARLNVVVHVMGALPGDTLEDTFDTHDAVVAAGAQPCLFHTRVLPGTALRDRAADAGFTFHDDPPYDMLQHASFTLEEHARYNRFGLTRNVLGAALPVVAAAANATATPASQIIEAIATRLDGSEPWRILNERWQWWNAAADPAFEAFIAVHQPLWDAAACAVIGEVARKLPPRHARVMNDYLRYVLAVMAVQRREPPVTIPAAEVGLLTRLVQGQTHVLLHVDCDVVTAIDRGLAAAAAAPRRTEWLLVRRTAGGTVTQRVNAAMLEFLGAFAHATPAWRAIERYAGKPIAHVDETTVRDLLAIARTLAKDGILMIDQSQTELARGKRLTLRLVDDDDLPAITAIYNDNPAFFRLITGRAEVPAEYVLSDMKEGPPGYDAQKYFAGLFLGDSEEMVGVADFVVSYPVQGKGFLGLLLVAERYQGQGLGLEAVSLLEQWAAREHEVREIDLGVELVNERARRFWRRCGYAPTGETFVSRALDRDHDSELLHKDLEQ